jgi:hypothetical protein
MLGCLELYRGHVVAVWGAYLGHIWVVWACKCVFCRADWVPRAIQWGFYHAHGVFLAIKCRFYYTEWGVLWT